jgi:ATP-binding cassette, subfamily B, bacterial MsbA
VRGLARLYSYLWPYRWWAALAFISMMTVAATNGALVALSRPLFDDVLIQESAEAELVDKRASTAARIILRRDDPEGERGPLVNTIDRIVIPVQAWWDAREEERWKIVLTALFIVFTLRAVSMFFSEYSFQKIGLSTIRDLRNDLYEAIIHQSNRFFAKRPTGELVSRIVSDVEMIQTAVSTRLGDLFQESANLLVLAAYVLFVNTELALVSFIAAPIIVVPIVQFAKRLKRATRISQERMANVATLLEETIRGVRIVKAFAMERFEINRFRETTERHLSINLKARRIQAMSSPVMELLAGICIILLVSYAALRIRGGVMTVGEFISFVMALALMYQPIKKLNKVNLTLNAALSASERVFSIIDQDNEVIETPGAESLDGVGTGIRYEGVSFSYGETEPVLRAIDLELRQGEMVALVGPSGAGKSTLVNLLPRFYDVDDGSIRIDGRDIRNVTLKSLREMIGVVTQEVVLFNDSVRNNIAYGRSDISMEQIRQAARAANAAEFIEAMPEGYESWIGEGGVLLSGGQRQRLAIARALLKNSPILILDEATSALDTESEQLVQEALLHLVEGRTTMVIAHRLSTVRRADKIIVLDRGRIVEQGSHTALLASNGLYRRLYEMQFSETDVGVSS